MAGKRADRKSEVPAEPSVDAADIADAAEATDAADAADAAEPVQPADEAIEVVDGQAYDDEDEDDEDLESFDEDDDVFGPMHDLSQQLTQLMITEDGVPIVDVMQGIQEAIEKQNKILYKLVSVVEAKVR